ncbi:FMN-dependent NADH-azoreductase [Prolixibacter sp. NT017]|uniref:FMN-dependent NADH-azoreductase n=1 Tax=Prolixibacter sp. NT017 TaxID=2652390 RepID=UPI0012762A92|nr:NAD(P)H-dependent oxidoreductase [Prolixibacter sp. NT017]GET26091.1 FMN-dependent NADH-azoreductase [Prolixibacter sp. NT017]
MKQILHIISSPKNEASLSRILGKKVIQNIKEKYPQANITEYDLSKIHMPHLTESHINAFFTPDEKITQIEKSERSVSDKAINELVKADLLVVEAPMYNWNIPSSLKAYFDQIARAGITFKYEYKGNSLLPTGLLKGKKAYIVTSSGGVYSEGKLKDYDFATNYVKFFLEVIGIEVVDIFRAEGQSTLGRDEALRKALDNIVIE